MKRVLILFLLLLSVTTPSSARERKAGVSINLERVIEVVGPITARSSFAMIEQLSILALANKSPIDIVFDSPGGDLITGYLVVDRMESLRRQGIQFRCFVRTVAASMAFQMLLHCDERYASPHAVVLWHPVRVFWLGPLTATDANIIATQLTAANEAVLSDLKEHLAMPEEQLMWHYTQETLHQATSLDKLIPGFFSYVGNNIVNLHEDEAMSEKEMGEESTSTENLLRSGTLIYLHERFVQ